MDIHPRGLYKLHPRSIGVQNWVVLLFWILPGLWVKGSSKPLRPCESGIGGAPPVNYLETPMWFLLESYSIVHNKKNRS